MRTTWVQNLVPEKQVQHITEPRYIVGSGQKTFGQLSDYEKVKFINDHEVFSCEFSPKNHVGMYYVSRDKWSGKEKGDLLTGTAWGICSDFANTRCNLFNALGIYTVYDETPNHAWTEIYMQSPEGVYRWYLFDYHLYEGTDVVTRPGATLKDSQKAGQKPKSLYKWCTWKDTFIEEY